MRPSFLSVLAAAMLLLAAPAARAADQIVIVVDTNRLWNETSAGKDVQRQLQELQTKISEGLKSGGEALQKDAEALKAKKDSLQITEAAFNQEIQSLRQKEVDLQRKLQEENQRMGYANQIARQKFYDTVEPVLIQLVKERKGSVLLETGQLLYVTPDIDITSEAIKRLEKTVKTLKVELEPKPEGPPAPDAAASNGKPK